MENIPFSLILLLAGCMSRTTSTRLPGSTARPGGQSFTRVTLRFAEASLSAALIFRTLRHCSGSDVLYIRRRRPGQLDADAVVPELTRRSSSTPTPPPSAWAAPCPSCSSSLALSVSFIYVRSFAPRRPPEGGRVMTSAVVPVVRPPAPPPVASCPRMEGRVGKPCSTSAVPRRADRAVPVHWILRTSLLSNSQWRRGRPAPTAIIPSHLSPAPLYKNFVTQGSFLVPGHSIIGALATTWHGPRRVQVGLRPGPAADMGAARSWGSSCSRILPGGSPWAGSCSLCCSTSGVGVGWFVCLLFA